MSRICEIEITDYMGTEHAHFKPKSLTVIRGANGTGKSSILKAIMKPFTRGHDPSIIRKGAKRAVVMWKLDTGQVVTYTTTPKTSTLEVVTADGMPVDDTPAAFVDRLGESWSIDPGQLLLLDTKTKGGMKALAAEISKAMPLEFTPADIEAALNQPLGFTFVDLAIDFAATSFPADKDSLDLGELDKWRKQMEGSRRSIGQLRQEASETVSALRRDLPGADDTDWSAECKRLEAERTDCQSRQSFERREIAAEAEAAREEARNSFQAQMEAINKAEGEAATELAAKFGPEEEAITAELATARERLAATQRAAGAKETIERMATKAAEMEKQYEAYSCLLAAIDYAKKAKLDDLPIPGLTVTQDAVLLDGIEWQNVNLSRRAGVCANICALRAGALPLIVFDDSEHFDSATKQEIRAAFLDAGFQIVMAEVDDTGPLKIETFDDGEASMIQPPPTDQLFETSPLDDAPRKRGRKS